MHKKEGKKIEWKKYLNGIYSNYKDLCNSVRTAHIQDHNSVIINYVNSPYYYTEFAMEKCSAVLQVILFIRFLVEGIIALPLS